MLIPIANQASHEVGNSYSFKGNLPIITIQDDKVLVSYAVRNLFTCIPQALAMNAVREVVVKDDEINSRLNLEKEEMVHCVELCLILIIFNKTMK